MVTLVDAIGAIAATLTTLCWLPQAIKIIRDKDTKAISLVTQSVFATGIAFWLAYGLAIGDWPLIVANIVTLTLVLYIVVMKIRLG